MVAIDTDRKEARSQPMLGESLLPVAAVFGPNASGKSNLIAAFTWLREAVQFSLQAWDDGIPIEPFAFGTGPSKPSEFIIESIINGIRFEYVLELDAEKVLYEGLFHYPEKKRKRIFEREGNDLKLQRGLGGLSGTRELLTECTLALSIARRFNEPLVSNFAQDLLRVQTLGLVSGRSRGFGGFGFRAGSSRMGPHATTRIFEESGQPSLEDNEIATSPIRDEDRAKALALLKLADLGIDDVLVETQEVAFPDGSGARTQQRIRLVHRTSDEHTPLDFFVESDGTQTWFRVIGPVLGALRNGSLLLVDELDANLHPTLSAQLIQLFHSHVTNPLGAQLVFTSHDTSLLNHLNRDEVWLTEKSPDGSTRLGALTEFASERVRKSQNLENAYLHGRFGALPQVDQTELLRALGLIG